MSEAVLSISHVLYELLQKQRLSEAELARKINVPRATINRLVAGRTPDPRASTLSAIAEYFEITVEQLLGKQSICSGVAQPCTVDDKSIPILSLVETRDWAKSLKRLEQSEQKSMLIKDACRRTERFAVRVEGDAMWPQFQEDSLLIISPKKEAKNRDFVLAYIKEKGEILFRQLLVEGKYRCLKAINNAFPSITLQSSDKIIGVLIEVRRHYA